MQDRHGRVVWGPGQPRVRTKTWGDPIKWNKKAALTGERPRVFCASLADVFDNEVPGEWRADLFNLIRATPRYRCASLKGSSAGSAKMLPGNFGPDLFPNVGLMATLANQDEWDRDYPKLAWFRGLAAWIGVSAEPLLGRIDIGDARPDWIITGGESGRGYRDLDMNAVRFVRDQCARNGVTFHHKQNGGLRGKDGGCLVDGIEHKHFPPALAA